MILRPPQPCGTEDSLATDDFLVDYFNEFLSLPCLSREEGIKWIKKERLPAFLESDCYFEYRLAKLVSQVRWSKSGMNFTVGSNFSPWIVKKPPSLPPPATEEDNLVIMKKFYVSLGEASYTQTKDWFALAKQSQQT
ncbi:regulator of G protein signaling 22, partial [Homo sapiens]